MISISNPQSCRPIKIRKRFQNQHVTYRDTQRFQATNCEAHIMGIICAHPGAGFGGGLSLPIS